MSAFEMVVVSLLTLGRVSAAVLFILLIVKPNRFSRRMRVAICIFAFLACLPLLGRRWLR